MEGLEDTTVITMLVLFVVGRRVKVNSVFNIHKIHISDHYYSLQNVMLQAPKCWPAHGNNNWKVKNTVKMLSFVMFVYLCSSIGQQ